MDELIAALYLGRKSDEIAAEVIEKDVINAEQQRRLARERDGNDGFTATVSVNSTIIIGKTETERAAAQNRNEAGRRSLIDHRHTPDELRKRMSGYRREDEVKDNAQSAPGDTETAPAGRKNDDTVVKNDERRYHPVDKKYDKTYADKLRKKFTDR